MSDSNNKKMSAWVLPLFVVFVAGLYVFTQMRSTSGPQIQWAADLDRALAQAKAENKKVFLYLFEASNPLAERVDREVLTQRWAREPLAKLVCVRIDLKKDRTDHLKIRQQYDYSGEPKMVVVDASGKPVAGSIQGIIDQKSFFTYIERMAK